MGRVLRLILGKFKARKVCGALVGSRWTSGESGPQPLGVCGALARSRVWQGCDGRACNRGALPENRSLRLSCPSLTRFALPHPAASALQEDPGQWVPKHNIKQHLHAAGIRCVPRSICHPLL